MKLLVLGAAGKTGEAIVNLALQRGFQVTAFVHTPADYHRSGVRALGGDARDPHAMRDAVTGQDAVIDALGGHLPFLKTTLETDSARNVIDSMTAAGVRRLLVISTIGVGDSINNVHSFYRHFLMPTMLHGVMPDKASMEQTVRESQLDWTIVRPAGLTDGDPEGIHTVAPDAGDPEAAEKVRFITRADLATFLLDQLASPAYVHRAIAIAGPHS